MPLRLNIVTKNIVVQTHLLSYSVVSPKKPRGTLLLLHGWRSNSSIWSPILTGLVDNNYTVYCLDLPGFGKSETPQKPFTLDDYTMIVKEFLRKLAINNLTLVGHSFGGAVAIKTSILIPDSIKALVLIDSSGIRKTSASIEGKKIMAKILKPVFSLYFMQGIKKAIYRLIEAEDYIVTPELKATYLNILKDNLSSELPKIKQKTLLIWGSNDKNTPVQHARLMHQSILQSKLEILSNAGHFSFIDKPEEFKEKLNNFLNEIYE